MVTYTITPDKEDFLRILADSLELVFGYRPEAIDLEGQYELENKIVGHVDPATGEVRHLIASQRIEAEGELRIEIKSLREVDPGL